MQLDEVLPPELVESQDVSRMLATDPNSTTASGQIRTDDRRFTISEPDVPPGDTR